MYKEKEKDRKYLMKRQRYEKLASCLEILKTPILHTPQPKVRGKKRHEVKTLLLREKEEAGKWQKAEAVHEANDTSKGISVRERVKVYFRIVLHDERRDVCLK